MMQETCSREALKGMIAQASANLPVALDSIHTLLDKHQSSSVGLFLVPFVLALLSGNCDCILSPNTSQVTPSET
jgi:hypothetical protein